MYLWVLELIFLLVKDLFKEYEKAITIGLVYIDNTGYS